jgi:hypothetical protein
MYLEILRGSNLPNADIYSTTLKTAINRLYEAVPFEKIMVAHVTETFIDVYGTQRFLTVFTRAHHRPLPRARCSHTTSSHSSSFRINLLTSHLGTLS